jgi:hypothetical protein
MITHNPEFPIGYESIKCDLTGQIARVKIGALGDGGPVDAEVARVSATGNPVSTYSDHPLYKTATFGAETVLTLKHNQIPASDTGRPICSPIYQNPIT